LINSCIYLSGILLLLAAIAKFVSASGNAHVLQVSDPIFGIAFRRVFWIVGTIELGVALVCFSSKSVVLQSGLLAWLATSFLVYRLGLMWTGYQKPCACLGSLTDALPISPKTVNFIIKCILGYLLTISYSVLFWCWRRCRVPLAPSSSGMMTDNT